MTSDEHQTENYDLTKAEIRQLRWNHRREAIARRAVRIALSQLGDEAVRDDRESVERLCNKITELTDFGIIRLERTMLGRPEFESQAELCLALREYEIQRQSIQKELDAVRDSGDKAGAKELLACLCECKTNQDGCRNALDKQTTPWNDEPH